MRRIKEIIQVGIAAILVAGSLALGWPAPTKADTANAPSLVISQLKITSSGGQFIALYNSTNAALDMGKYQLEYFNNYDLSKATSSKLISLSGVVPPHGYFMVNDGSLLLCYQLTVDSVSLGLSSTAGLVEVLGFNQNSPGGPVTPSLQDYVGWSKTAANGAQTLPANSNAFLQRQPVEGSGNPAIGSAGTGSWQSVQPDTNNACNLVGSSNNTTPALTGLSQLLPSSEPAATIVDGDNNSGGTQTIAPGLPAADTGLMTPRITEILPNPVGVGNDATDEFIELYNANDSAFDLSGFGLQVGTTSLHNYSFPGDTSLPAHSFTAFYSSTTGLSLSNSGGQADLLDPFGKSVDSTDVYGTAKDGQAWALGNAKWYWTTTPTPNKANVINQPVSKKTSSKTSTTKNKSSKAAPKPKESKTSSTTTGQTPEDQPGTTPIHPWTLALVAAAALLYGLYEYRADLANRIYQFRAYLRTRRGDRP